MPNPTPEAAERTQRHLAMCQEMAQLGMQLLRATAAQALAEQAAQAKAQAEAAPTDTPPRPPASFALFAKLSRAVSQAMLLEARIAAGHEAAVKAGPAFRRDDRRDFLRETIHRMAVDRPDGLDFKCHAFERIDDLLARDSSACIPDLVATLAETLGLVITEDQYPPQWRGVQAWPPIPPHPQPDPLPPNHAFQHAPQDVRRS